MPEWGLATCDLESLLLLSLLLPLPPVPSPLLLLLPCPLPSLLLPLLPPGCGSSEQGG